ARDAGERAAARRGDFRRALDRPLPRPQAGHLEQARGEHYRAVRLPLPEGRARRVAREDQGSRGPEPPGPRADEQLPPAPRGAEREGPGRFAGVRVTALTRRRRPTDPGRRRAPAW